VKKLIAGIIVAVAVAGCGSAGHSVSISAAQSAKNKQDEVKVERQVQSCLPQKDGAPDPLLLRSHSARVSFENCVVPPAKKAQFNRCLLGKGGVLSGFPTKNRLKAVANKCAAEVA
jgi:hypothetical protein